MSKKFYSHLIEIGSLTIELDEFEMQDHEKNHLAHLVDSNIHNIVMDAILSKLKDEDKKKFVELVMKDDHQKIWDFLNEKTDDVTEDIKKAAHEFKKKLHEDVKEAKKKGGSA